MNILVINCSPVRNGATAEIVKEISSFLENGNNVKAVCIDDYDIQPARSIGHPVEAQTTFREEKQDDGADQETVKGQGQVGQSLHFLALVDNDYKQGVAQARKHNQDNASPINNATFSFALKKSGPESIRLYRPTSITSTCLPSVVSN